MYKYRQKQYIYKLKKQLKRKNGRLRAVSRTFKAMQEGPLKPGGDGSLALFGKDRGVANDAQRLARRGFRYYGPGDYTDALKWGSRGLGGLAGGAMGWMNGGVAGISGGAASGWNSGADFSKFMGWGDYSANQIVGGGNSSQISVNQQNLTGDIYISRTEFVQNVVCSNVAAGASGFEITAFQLNPGLSSTFPWLSQIAQNFTMYEWCGLMYQYKPTFTESAGSSNNLGKVIFATNYDPNASPFFTSVQMENYDYANACKPSDGLIHGVETKNSQQFGNMQYVRTGATTRDKVFTDIGTTYLATEGIPFSTPGTQIIGELWVTYYVKLSRAALYNSLLGLAISNDSFAGSSLATSLVSSVQAATDNSIGTSIANISATSLRITFPINISLGFYQIYVFFSAGATVFTTQHVTAFSGLTNLTMFRPGVLGSPFTAVAPSSTAVQYVTPGLMTGTVSNPQIGGIGYVQINAPGLAQASIIVNVNSALSNTTSFAINILQCNQNMTLTTV